MKLKQGVFRCLRSGFFRTSSPPDITTYGVHWKMVLERSLDLATRPYRFSSRSVTPGEGHGHCGINWYVIARSILLLTSWFEI